jgi:hypothetical protein
MECISIEWSKNAERHHKYNEDTGEELGIIDSVYMKSRRC